LGGMISISSDIYKQILGILLLIPVIRFIGFGNRDVGQKLPVNLLMAILIGACIGFLSGMIGIGGGIILSPVLLLLHWANQKEAAAVSAAFIFVNSVAGLSGQFISEVTFDTNMYLFVIIAFTGGLAGSYLGSHRFDMIVLKRILGFVLFIASIKLLMV
ncbi:MAG: TSUP family transporter, partial [Flavisolibacter sp.]